MIRFAKLSIRRAELSKSSHWLITFTQRLSDIKSPASALAASKRIIPSKYPGRSLRILKYISMSSLQLKSYSDRRIDIWQWAPLEIPRGSEYNSYCERLFSRVRYWSRMSYSSFCSLDNRIRGYFFSLSRAGLVVLVDFVTFAELVESAVPVVDFAESMKSEVSMVEFAESVESSMLQAGRYVPSVYRLSVSIPYAEGSFNE